MLAFNQGVCMRILAPNRHELWVSFAVVFYAVLQSSIPVHFADSLILAAGLLIATFCALNAYLDRDEMNLIERSFSFYWLVLLILLTPYVIYSLGAIKTFANK
jgi:hypothetical protein